MYLLYSHFSRKSSLLCSSYGISSLQSVPKFAEHLNSRDKVEADYQENVKKYHLVYLRIYFPLSENKLATYFAFISIMQRILHFSINEDKKNNVAKQLV
jgi:hypothetical protein